MSALLKTLVDVCTLKAGPQDLPMADSTKYTAIFFYWLLGVIVISLSQTFGEAVFIALVQTILLIFFTQIVLWITKRPERQTQTITALTGSGAIVTLIALPVLVWLNQSAPDDTASLATAFWLMLFIWETLIIGHIFRHALDMSFFAGLGVSMLYVFVTFTITVRFIRVMSMGVAP